MIQLSRLLFLCVIAFVFSTKAFAQKNVVFYLKNNGREVHHKDSADFIRIIQKPDSSGFPYKVLEFFPNNSRKFVGEVSSFEPKLVYMGPTMQFYENGKKSAQVTYKGGIPYGLAYYFYPNGKLKRVVRFDYQELLKDDKKHPERQFRLVSSFDSTGAEQVSDGDGFAVLTDNDEMNFEKGRYLRGVKDGVWKGEYRERGRSYEELYREGKFISGQQTSPDGSKFNYSMLEEPLQYSGGEKAFFMYMMRNFKYPPMAREQRIVGRMDVTFTIQPDGTVADIRSNSFLHASINQSITNVLQKSGKWIPAKIKGLPVRANHQVGFDFNIGQRPSKELSEDIPRLYIQID